ncbi:cyanocobalamin reductase / alkylcobalamin dealkylase [Nelusetta ayraudi]|uniref:cyanocobalamin reductase / alkylcobalamin dealkylase n=1 Tax=Nelusetta ayraudi TaxID=303726 RepID=UPI003F71FEF6
MAAPANEVQWTTGSLESCLTKFGFEVYPLKVGWYNSMLPATLHLPYQDDCLAVVVLSTPSMFEEAFLPFMEENGCQGLTDPIDQCVRHHMSAAVEKCFPGQDVDVRYDFELFPNRKPKFLAQTAAHVSGGAFYYQQSNVEDHPWTKKMFGVCVHPRFGGWFAIRALMVFRGVTVGSEMVQPLPPDCVPTREDRIHLLEAFNYHWQDWSYRDIIPPVQTYSLKQRDYFATLPARRFDLLESWGFLAKEKDQAAEGLDSDHHLNGHG